MNEQAPRVLISYAQEGESHAAWVRKFAARLRSDGILAVIDQYVEWPEKGWRAWMSEQLDKAGWVLLICTAEYRRRFEGKEDVPSDTGRGVRWESQHITQALYDDKFRNLSFVPVLPPNATEQDIPLPLRDYPKFKPGDNFQIREDDANREGYTALYRLLTDQPAHLAPAPGNLRRLAPLSAPDLVPITTPTPPAAIPNPYPGLAAFTEDQARHFFGRTKDIPRVLAPLRAGHFVCVSGSSGTGKSSLVAAGVLPALRLELQASGRFCVRFTPRSDPLAEFAKAIHGYLPEERLRGREPREQRIAGELRTEPAAPMARHFAPPAPVLIFADQFEELFTQTPEGERTCFKTVFDALRGATNLYVVLTLRSEFFAQLVDWLGGEVLDNLLVPLSAIDDDARYRELISRPAADCGVPIEEALVTELAATARGMAGSLPLLALTLQRLFAGRDPALGITLAAYEATGGLAESVRSATREVDDEIDADATLAAACDRLFATLATAVEGLPTRHTAKVAPLRADPSISRLIDDLRAQGLLADPDDAHVEIVHETLFAYWPRLNAWCERHVLKLARRREAEQAARDWRKAAGDESAADLRRASDLLRWGWERQKLAIEAMVALDQRPLVVDPDYTDPGIHAWRALEGELDEPLKSFLYPEPLRLLDELANDDTPHYRREDIGRRLNQMPDPRRGVGLDDQGLPDIAWESIEAGEVTLQINPPRSFPVAPFRIARYPVTWSQYRAFVEADDGYRDRRWWDGLEQEAQPRVLRWAFDNHPVINVSWYDAVAFCRWLSHRLGLTGESAVRLPIEWEWQWVAQASRAALKYPWGRAGNAARLNSAEAGIGRTMAVGLYPLGCPAGKRVLDLTGNVWEWCLNEYQHPDHHRPAGDAPRALRGGAWSHDPVSCRAAYRNRCGPDARSDFVGFRVCRGSPIDPPGASALNTGVQDR